MLSMVKVAVIAVTLFFCSSVGHAQQAQTLTQAVQLIGLAGLNENTKGKLTVRINQHGTMQQLLFAG